LVKTNQWNPFQPYHFLKNTGPPLDRQVKETSQLLSGGGKTFLELVESESQEELGKVKVSCIETMVAAG
jgi:hypothetical protein